MEPLHPALALLLGVFVAPIGSGLLAALLTRKITAKTPDNQAFSALGPAAVGMTLGVLVAMVLAQRITLAWPQLPAMGTPDWLSVAAGCAVVGAMLAAAVDAVVHGSVDAAPANTASVNTASANTASVNTAPPRTARVTARVGATLLIIAATMVWMYRPSAAIPGPGWAWIVAMTVATWLAWLALDGILARLPAWAIVVVLSLFGSAVAGLLVLGKTVVIAQLIGSLTAVLGGGSLAALLLKLPKVAARSLALPATLVAATALTQARHYAYLPTVTLVAVVTTICAVWLLLWWLQRGAESPESRGRSAVVALLVGLSLTVMLTYRAGEAGQAGGSGAAAGDSAAGAPAAGSTFAGTPAAGAAAADEDDEDYGYE